jgi:hypothetical protein
MDTSIQIQGQRLSAARVKSFLFSLANQISGERELSGSMDQDQYGSQLSFVVNGAVVGLSILRTEGGMVC